MKPLSARTRCTPGSCRPPRILPEPGATPPARPGMPPEGVLAVECLDNPRDNTRGKALWTSLLSLGPQEECPMAFVGCYTGTDGQSHFEDLDLLPPDSYSRLASPRSPPS